MKITDFNDTHMEQARALAVANYREARDKLPDLPKDTDWPDYRWCAQNHMGVAAFEEDRLLGFLCGTAPFANAFQSTGVTGVFSPLGANGAVPEGRGEILARLYQAAGEKWARAGAPSHAVCLYATDEAGQRQLVELGFGIRCMDGICRLGQPEEADGEEPGEYVELPPDQWLRLLPLEHMLDSHMAASPTFILRPSQDAETFTRQSKSAGARYFAALQNKAPVAFLKVDRSGETFLCGRPDYLHVSGAFCLPAHRGTGLYAGLLRFVKRRLRREGYAYLGVDFESINPAAHRFWRKHFCVYTHSLTRRVDEYAVERLSRG